MAKTSCAVLRHLSSIIWLSEDFALESGILVFGLMVCCLGIRLLPGDSFERRCLIVLGRGPAGGGCGGRIILTSRYKSQRFPSWACDSPPVLFEGKESCPSSQAGHLPRGKCGIYLQGKPNPAAHTLRYGLYTFKSKLIQDYFDEQV